MKLRQIKRKKKKVPGKKNYMSLEGTRGLAPLLSGKNHMQSCNHAPMQYHSPSPQYPITPLPHAVIYRTGDLARGLPDYMIPSDFIVIDKIPLNPSGKIDRKALPAPLGFELKVNEHYAAPRNALEEKLVKIWSGILGHMVGINDNFFKCGGHSLKATILAAKLYRAFYVKVPLGVIFTTPTIKGLAAYIDSALESPFVCIEPVEKKEHYALSAAQKIIYVTQQMAIDSTATYKIYMKEVGEIPAYSMGHSPGEYSALCCAGIVQFPETLNLVKERSGILNEVAFTMDGIMAWVINLDNKIVENVCTQEREHGHQVYVSAYDAPKQSSISGTKEAVMQVGRKLEKEGAIVYPLKLSGPFHSPLMEQAAEKFKAILLGCTFSSPIYPVIANYNARPYNDKNCLADCFEKT